MQNNTKQIMEKSLEGVDEQCNNIEFLHGVPVDMPYIYKKRIRDYLTSTHQAIIRAMIEDEKGRKRSLANYPTDMENDSDVIGVGYRENRDGWNESKDDTITHLESLLDNIKT